MEWRTTTSPQAQQDLDSLLSETIQLTARLLAEQPTFAPFLLAIATDGQKQLRHIEIDAPGDDVAILSALTLHDDVDRLRARALVYDATAREPFTGDAIKVAAEHREGLAIDMLIPYIATDESITIDIDAANSAVGTRHLWPSRHT